MNDGRNFRSLYYEKVGCKSVEERKSLEILFKEKVIDVNRLRQFCSRFSVPFHYRSYVWRVVFGVVPANKSCHEFVMKERESQYFDLKHGLEATNMITPDTPKENKFFQMWLLEKHSLMCDVNTQMNIEFHQHLLAITRTLIGIFDSEVDVYWLAKGFFEYLKSWYEAIPSMIESTKTVLKKEDSTLYSYLTETNLLNEIPMDTWFGRCFAGVLHESAVIRVWDKIIGGSYRVLIFVCSVFLTTMRRVLLTCANISQIITCVESVSYETADIVVSKSIDMWLTHGRSVLPSPLRHPRTPPTTRIRRKREYFKRVNPLQISDVRGVYH